MSAPAASAPPPRGLRLRPPFLAGLLVGAAFGADAAWPAPRWIAPPWTWAGLAPAASGIALAAWALGLFRRRSATHHPFHDPTALVVDGPYRFTRNPMYLGVTLALVGVALLSGSAWLTLPPTAFWISIDRLQVPREEEALARLFGERYAAYRGRVRRWI